MTIYICSLFYSGTVLQLQNWKLFMNSCKKYEPVPLVLFLNRFDFELLYKSLSLQKGYPVKKTQFFAQISLYVGFGWKLMPLTPPKPDQLSHTKVVSCLLANRKAWSTNSLSHWNLPLILLSVMRLNVGFLNVGLKGTNTESKGDFVKTNLSLDKTHSWEGQNLWNSFIFQLENFIVES